MYELQFIITDGPRENEKYDSDNHKFLKMPYIPRVDEYIRIEYKEYKIWKVMYSFFDNKFSCTDCWMFQTSLED